MAERIVVRGTALRLATPVVIPMSMVALLLASCDDRAPAEGEGESVAEGEGEAPAAAFEVLATTTIDEAVPLAIPGLAIAARADGRFAVAWFEETADEITCDLFSGGQTSTASGAVYALKVGDEQGDGTVRVREVDRVPTTSSNAVDLAIDPTSDALLVAYTGGETTRTHCGASDLMLAVESGDAFTISSVATTAQTTSPCRGTAGGDPYCSQGEVVGLSPGIAVNGSGHVAINYVDTHFGFGNDDITATDLELARGNDAQALALSSISPETGAGQFGASVLRDDDVLLVGHWTRASNQFVDDEGRPYTISDGIYADVVHPDGSIVETQLLDGARTDGRVAVAQHDGAGLSLAVHQSGDEQLLLYTSVDDGASWTAAPIEQLGRTGRNPAMLYLDDGRLVLAYGHCRDNTARDECDAAHDGVRLAIRAPGDTRFAKQTLAGDSEDLEGVNVDAARAGPDELVVASLDVTSSTILVHRVKAR